MSKAVIQSTTLLADGTLSLAAGAEIAIRNPSGVLVTLYADRDGTQTVTNPVTADEQGWFRVYVDPGRVDITVSANGYSRTIKDHPVFDAGYALADLLSATNQGVYADTAAGLAATADGEYFTTPTDDTDAYLILYRNVAGAASEVSRVASVSAMANALSAAEQAGLEADAAETARTGAETAQSLAEAAQSATETARDQAQTAAEASGDVRFFNSYAEAEAATLDEGQVVEVFSDETRDNQRARYRVESGALVFKFLLDFARKSQLENGTQAVSSFSGGHYTAAASGNTLTIPGTPVDELTGEPKFHVGRRVFCEGEARTITAVATEGGNTVVTVDGAALSAGSVGVWLGGSVRKPSIPWPWVDVRSFGAAFDGTTDDTAALQAACDTGAPMVMLPEGTDRNSVLRLADGQTLWGQGRKRTVLKLLDNLGVEDGTVYGVCAVDANAQFVGVRALSLDGNAANNRSWNGVVTNIGEIKTNNLNFGDQAYTTAPPREIYIHDVDSHSCVRNPIVLSLGVEAGSVTSCRFADSDGDHLIYAQYCLGVNFSDITCEGYWDRAAIVTQSCNINNITFRNLSAHPLAASARPGVAETFGAEWYIQERFAGNPKGSNISNIQIELDTSKVERAIFDCRGKGTKISNVQIIQTDASDTAWRLVETTGSDTESISVRGVNIRAASSRLEILLVQSGGLRNGAFFSDISVRYRDGAVVAYNPLFDLKDTTTALAVSRLSTHQTGMHKLLTADFNTPMATYTGITFDQISVENDVSVQPIVAIGGAFSPKVLVSNSQFASGTPVDPAAVTYRDVLFGLRPSSASDAVTASGDGVTTTFQWPHGLPGAPSEFDVVAQSADSTGERRTLADGTYIKVIYASAPPAGTDNLVLHWKARLSA